MNRPAAILIFELMSYRMSKVPVLDYSGMAQRELEIAKLIQSKRFPEWLFNHVAMVTTTQMYADSTAKPCAGSATFGLTYDAAKMILVGQTGQSLWAV